MTTALEGGEGVRVTPRPLFTSGKDPVPIVQEAGWDPGPVWTGAKNLAPTGIPSPDRPARSQSLYRLSYPARSFYNSNTKISLTEIIHDKYIARTDNHFILPHFKRRDWKLFPSASRRASHLTLCSRHVEVLLVKLRAMYLQLSH